MVGVPRDEMEFPKLGVFVGGPHNQDYRVLVSIWESPYFRNYHV